MTDEPRFKYSEIFGNNLPGPDGRPGPGATIQGEGHYTGYPTLWVRWFLCNLECRGFGQIDPADRSTYQVVGNDMDLEGITHIDQLPVFKFGCDTAYSVSKRYRDLYPEETGSEIAAELTRRLTNEFNPSGRFLHPHSLQHTHMCFTGGEPMIRRSQQGTQAVLEALAQDDNLPQYVTIETNGTKSITPELAQFIQDNYSTPDAEWFWSVSPKLMHTSGEPFKRAIKPEAVLGLQDASPHGQLKFVVRNAPEAWDELEERVAQFREAGVKFPIWVMPVGSTEESQQTDDTRAVVEEAIRRGYRVSARVHAYIWGNTVGV